MKVWGSWFRAWWAGHWTLDDLPQLRFIIRLQDRVLRGDVKRLGELRQWLDAYGITPKGQQDRRWERPAPPKPATTWSGASRLRRLRVTPEAERQAGATMPGEPLTARQRYDLERYGTTDPTSRQRLAVLEGTTVPVPPGRRP